MDMWPELIQPSFPKGGKCAPHKNTGRWEPLPVLGRLELRFFKIRWDGMVVFSTFLILFGRYYPPRNQQQVYPWKTSLSFFCFGLCSGAFFTFLGVYMYPYFVDERNRLCHGFRHLCVLLLHVDPPFQLLVVQKHKEKRNMWQWQRNGVCRFVHMYNVRNKQRKRGP